MIRRHFRLNSPCGGRAFAPGTLMRDYLRTAAVCRLFLVGAAQAAEAQETGVARSFEELVALVHPDDTVTVIDTTSTEVSDRIDRVSEGFLALLTDDGSREWLEAEVRTIRHGRTTH